MHRFIERGGGIDFIRNRFLFKELGLEKFFLIPFRTFSKNCIPSDFIQVQG